MKRKQKNKCLLNSILRLTNLTTMVSVITMTIVMLIIFGQGFNLFENKLDQYYVEKTEDIINLSVVEKDGETTARDDGRLYNEIKKLHDTVPYMTIEVVLNDKYVYRGFGSLFINEIFNIGMEKADDNLPDKIKEISSNYVVKELLDSNSDVYGVVSVGVDPKLIAIVHVLLVLIVIPIALLVMFIMGLLAKKLTKPILNPINQLIEQLNHLAGEEYENLAPSLEIDIEDFREVYELSLATNGLLRKMLDYNEVITQSEKMASIGQLTAAITHEINTPLGAINANVGIIKLLTDSMTEDMCNESEFKEIKQQIIEASNLSEEACERIDKIIRSLKMYSRIDQANFMPADINESVNSVIVLTTNLHKNRVVVNTEFGDIPKVFCHIGLMNQVFMNIFINAIQSIEKKGEITIKTYHDEENVYVTIADTGCGISQKNIYNIFQYGFTTKQPGSGSGIGLALSNNIIKKHNGSIKVDSIEGEGSVFTVTIPLKQSDNK
ncbi:MAG: sensor histidine kinase [Sedimentibacter sp.]